MTNHHRLVAFAAAALLALPCAALAEGKASPKQEEQKPKKPELKEVAERMTEELSRGLELTEAQKTKIRVVIEQGLPERLELEKKVHKLERDNDEKIRALLDDDQKERFDRARVMGRMQGGIMPPRMAPGGGPGPGMRGQGMPGGPDGPSSMNGPQDGPPPPPPPPPPAQ